MVGIPCSVVNHKHLKLVSFCVAVLPPPLIVILASLPLNFSLENVNSLPTVLQVCVLCDTFNLPIWIFISVIYWSAVSIAFWIFNVKASLSSLFFIFFDSVIYFLVSSLDNTVLEYADKCA